MELSIFAVLLLGGVELAVAARRRLLLFVQITWQSVAVM